MPAYLLFDPLLGLDPVLAARLGRLGDKRPLLAEIGEHLKTTTDERFDTQTAPDGTAWAPLSPVTLGLAYRMKGRRVFKKGKGGVRTVTAGFARYRASKQMLRESGLMRRSIAPRVSGDSVSLGSSRIYAAIQQLGGKAGRNLKVDIPARPFVGLSENDRSVVREMIVAFVADRLGAEG